MAQRLNERKPHGNRRNPDDLPEAILTGHQIGFGVDLLGKVYGEQARLREDTV